MGNKFINYLVIVSIMASMFILIVIIYDQNKRINEINEFINIELTNININIDKLKENQNVFISEVNYIKSSQQTLLNNQQNLLKGYDDLSLRIYKALTELNLYELRERKRVEVEMILNGTITPIEDVSLTLINNEGVGVSGLIGGKKI